MTVTGHQISSNVQCTAVAVRLVVCYHERSVNFGHVRLCIQNSDILVIDTFSFYS